MYYCYFVSLLGMVIILAKLTTLYTNNYILYPYYENGNAYFYMPNAPTCRHRCLFSLNQYLILGMTIFDRNFLCWMYRLDLEFVWKCDTFCLYIREEWKATVQNPQYHKVLSKQIFLNNVKISLDTISIHFAALHLQTFGHITINIIDFE